MESAAADLDPGDCLFEHLLSIENDRESLILHKGKTCFIVLNAFPYTNGHMMVVPFRHTPDMSELSDAEMLEINQFVALALNLLKAAYKPDGFNVGVNLGRPAGAGVPGHIHWHVLPRWNGDTNFMTSIGETRVLPQSLQDSYERLKAVLDAR